MIFNVTGGGGGSGGTLTVTAPEGVTVTISKYGKSKTKVADASGVAVFKGLETGTWTVVISDGSQTSAPKTVTITADYATTMSFFAATINVTYPAGSTCTATDGVTTLTAPDTSGTWECTVSNAGTWMLKVTATDGTESESKYVTINTDGQTERVELDFDTYIFKTGEGAKETLNFDVRPENISVTNDAITVNGKQGIAFGMSRKIDISQYKGMRLEYTASKVMDGDASYSAALALSNTTTPNTSNHTDTTKYPYSKRLTVTSEKVVLDFPFTGAGQYCPFVVGTLFGKIYNWWLY